MNNRNRRQEALRVRISAAELAHDRPHPRHVANDDEQKFRRDTVDGCGNPSSAPSFLASFTKGMAHDYKTGLLQNSADYQDFVKAVDSGNPRDFIDTWLGPMGATEANPGWKSDKANTPPFGNRPARIRAWESQGAGNTFDLEGPDAQAVTVTC